MPRKVIAVVDDLFFTVKIIDAAKRAGMELAVITDEERVLASALESPALILFDLNAKAVDAVSLIAKLKGNRETAGVPIAGFVSHVQVELTKSAREAGADLVVPRSRFVTDLPQILETTAQKSSA